MTAFVPFCAMAFHAKICRVLRRAIEAAHRRNATCEGGRELAGDKAWMGGVGIPPLCADPGFCVVSRRNDSLGSRWRRRVCASVCIVSFGLALGFAALGAWMVLPYSTLEMAVLYLAFRWIERHAADWERLSIRGDRVIIERERAGIRTRREFNRY